MCHDANAAARSRASLTLAPFTLSFLSVARDVGEFPHDPAKGLTPHRWTGRDDITNMSMLCLLSPPLTRAFGCGLGVCVCVCSLTRNETHPGREQT